MLYEYGQRMAEKESKSQWSIKEKFNQKVNMKNLKTKPNAPDFILNSALNLLLNNIVLNYLPNFKPMLVLC